jgi:small subunit ribosomal protein S2
MKGYIFTERNGIHIIDLQKTIKKIEEACQAVHRTAQAGKPILFVGTKKQAADIIDQESERCEMFHVTERWLGGMLTNWQTIRQSIRHLDHLDQISTDGTYEKLKKKEVLLLEKERDRLGKTIAGIRKMGGLPGLVFIVDIKKEHIAVLEAQKLRIPSVALIDTNCNPEAVTHPIPGNDDALRSISLIAHLMAEAVLEGKAKAGENEDAEAGDGEEERQGDEVSHG